ncbi:type II toxin-antitoxin system antitoxin SocA domain-containing protein [Nocardia sp. NPDC050697]|uniref:Panacea domain-containing protein n=1 Tax=Nocardia sp. NPDC050697 TaxID=3155158 RepID=UPI0033C72513
MTDVHDVAAYILERSGPMTTMKLQKLCYYSQGWSLAWDGVPLFPESFRAWANGPVCYELFDCHRGRFQVQDWQWGSADRLNYEQRETVDAVLASYGKLTGQQLSDKTHAERPWVETRGELPDGAGAATEIPLDLMQEFFGGLARSEII